MLGDIEKRFAHWPATPIDGGWNELRDHLELLLYTFAKRRWDLCMMQLTCGDT